VLRENAEQRRALLLSVWGLAARRIRIPLFTLLARKNYLPTSQEFRAGIPVPLRTSNVDVHHGVARFAWKFVMRDGSSLPEEGWT
jgi:hypothetical protein